MKKRLYSIGYMFVITLVFTSVVSGVKAVNQDRIAENERAKRQRVILGVLGLLPPDDSAAAAIGEIFDERVRTETIAGRPVYAALREDGSPAAYAFEVAGAGFWGPIQSIVAVSAEADRIVGIDFFRHTETPGLGARITEPWFRDQFKDIRLDPGSDAPFFRLVPAGTAQGPAELDAITGATETSRSVQRFVNRELRDFLRGFKAGTTKDS